MTHVYVFLFFRVDKFFSMSDVCSQRQEIHGSGCAGSFLCGPVNKGSMKHAPDGTPHSGEPPCQWSEFGALSLAKKIKDI